METLEGTPEQVLQAQKIRRQMFKTLVDAGPLELSIADALRSSAILTELTSAAWFIRTGNLPAEKLADEIEREAFGDDPMGDWHGSNQ
jgi:hypothetical protein